MRPYTKRIVDHFFRISALANDALARRDDTIYLPDELAGPLFGSSHHAPEELLGAFSLWPTDGARVVALSGEMAEQLSGTDPPGYDGVQSCWSQLQIHSLLIEVENAVVFVWIAPEADLNRVNSIVYTEPGTPCPDFLGPRRGHVFVEMIGYILNHRPEGLTVAEHKPSLKAARKRARREGRVAPAHLPGTLYVIASDVAFQRGEIERVHRECVAASLKTKHLRRGHFRRQPHGKARALRKIIWIAPMWIGPEDGPVVVRARRLDVVGGDA